MDAQSYASDVAFSPSVKAIQTRKGSRASYHKQEERGWRTEITADLAEFIAAQTSFMLATASADGQPYIQHRGGPAGFLRVLDERTLAFADFAGNRQYITQGNLAENAKAYIFIIDYLNPAADQTLGHRAGGRERFRAAREADAGGLSGAGRAGDRVHGVGLGHQLPAAHSAEARPCRRRAGHRRARQAHRRA
jgi:predicted pyridoxine 5'-phosphate oxidase superfamily flavin-nucleotide-binding protein